MIKLLNYFILFVLLQLFFQIKTFASSGSVIFSEIAWMGNTNSANDEWIELKNLSSKDIDLSNWTIISNDGSPDITISGLIKSNSYFLLERTNDDSASWVIADQFYSWALWNNWELLYLKDWSWNIIDKVEWWHFWDNSSKQTMERNDDLTWRNWKIDWDPQSSKIQISLTWSGDSEWSLESISGSLLPHTWTWLDSISGSLLHHTWTWSEDIWWESDTGVLISTWVINIWSWENLVFSWEAIEEKVINDVETVIEDNDHNFNFIEVDEVVIELRQYNVWDLIISEVITDPQQDWSFLANTKDKKVNLKDEWIEIYNNTNEDIFLKDWSLKMLDSSLVTKVFVWEKITAKWYYIFIDPVWSLNNNVKLELIDPNSKIIDTFDLSSDIDWNSKSVNDESVSKVFDFTKIVKTKASPGKKNIFINSAPISVISLQANSKTKWIGKLIVNVTWEWSIDNDNDKLNFYWDFWDWALIFTWSNPLPYKYWVWNYRLSLRVSDRWWNIWESFIDIEVLPEVKKKEPEIWKWDLKLNLLEGDWDLLSSRNSASDDKSKINWDHKVKQVLDEKKVIKSNLNPKLKYSVETKLVKKSNEDDLIIWKIENIENDVLYLKWWMSVKIPNYNSLINSLKFVSWSTISIWSTWDIKVVDLALNKEKKSDSIITNIVNFIVDIIKWFTFRIK